MNSNISEIEESLVQSLDVDYVPLNDVVREFCGYDGYLPSDNEFEEILHFLTNFIQKHDLRILFALEKEIDITTALNIIREKWYQKKYDDIDYAIWFDWKSGQHFA